MSATLGAEMIGLVNRAVERFLRDTYGREFWIRLMRDLECGFFEFEGMLSYEDVLTQRLIAGAGRLLDRPQEDLLEDLGTYLVSHPGMEPVRRLLRFGGREFVEFLTSLEDLPERTRLAVPDLHFPEIRLHEAGPGRYRLSVGPGTGVGLQGLGHVLVGLLRAMADDYGALVLIAHEGEADFVETLCIDLLETAFARGKTFELGGVAQG